MRKTIFKRFSSRWFACIVVVLTCMISLAVPSAVFGADSSVADNPTADNWSVLNYNQSEGRTTKNDGRIWTDKSVYTDDASVLKNQSESVLIKKNINSDFLVGLSALSSTMSVDGVTDKPLDIIMVLDVSGSMDESMGYSAVYTDDMTHQGKYYIMQNNSYTELKYSYNRNAWYYETRNGEQWITPKESATDTTYGRVQVYKPVTKMEVLADSVNDFIDTTKEKNNDKATSADMQHRVSIVKFSGNKSNTVGNTTYKDDGHTYNHSQIVKKFVTPADDATTKSLKDAVDGLTPAGATRADYGMQVAEGLMSDVRSNAQPVVIFFTDGIPTTFSDWSDSVANDAIKAAKNMKDKGAWIYSVGVFKDSDLRDNPNLDEYMQAVSSNYPKATGFTNYAMGTRVADGDYYSTAAEADELKAIFARIVQEISGKSAEFPTHIDEGYDAEKGGYITFVDELGQYMEVTSVNSVVFEGIEYKNAITEAAWNAAAADTDVFVNDATVKNDLGKEVSIDSVIVTVERSDDPNKGDIITVKVPAALVPLAYYNVTVNNEGAVTERIPTTPIRVFYEVGIKDEVDGLLANPDAKMAAYLAEHTDKDGKAVFYSNAYDEQTNAEIGSTVASFVPSKMNDMYYTVEDTLIYQDPECKTPVKRINENATYYYQRVYYVVSDTPVAPQYETVAFSASLLRNVNYGFNEDGQLYVKAGTGRYTRADATDTVKLQTPEQVANITETAAKAAAPRWEDWATAGSTVPVFLGNNGLLKKDVPGTLAISKDVVVPSWSTVDVNNKTFTFEVELKAGNDPVAGKSFDAQIKDADGKPVGNAIGITTDSEGKANVELEAGQTLYIYGLADGVSYTVKETSIIPGFKQTAPADDSGQPMPANGTIKAGEISKAEFVNTYSATGTLAGKTNLDGTKELSGRDWRETDVFAFALAPENAANPMPQNVGDIVDGMAIATVSGKDADKAFNFDDIIYTEPGTYRYDIREVIITNTADRVVGVSYSQDVYEVTVKVADNGDGNLNVVATMQKFGSDAATDSAEFKNTFIIDKVSFGIVGLKELNDTVGTYEIEDGDFTFQLEAVTTGAPMPEEGTDENGVYTTTNDGVSVSFGTIDCTLSEEAIKTAPGQKIAYTYKVKEVDGKKTGMTYDSNAYEVTVTFTWDETDGLAYKITYPGTDKWVTFKNTYDPIDAAIELEGIKYLKGRNWKDNETFKFVLEGLNGAPMPDKAKGNSTYEFTVEHNGNELNTGVFGQEITFKAPGTYEYTLSEVAGNAGGITYDNYVSEITVKVTDVNGELKAEKTVKARTDIEVKNGVSGFVNKYNASMTYPGLTVEKTLYGRDMSFGEFDFTIECMNPNSKTKGIVNADASFESGAHASGETCTNEGKLSSLKFTQEDAGKEFIYKINEVLPKDDDSQHEGIQSSGVTYDETEYWVIIVPKDNGDGTMDAITTIYTDEARTNKIDEWSTNDTEVPTVEFVNNYGYKTVTVETKTVASITKVFEGRDWLDSDKFSFQMSVAEDSAAGTPMPEGTADGVATVTVGKPAEGNAAVVDFGSIEFTKAGTYKYKITEIKGNLPNVTYDDHIAELVITVTDNGLGYLVASAQTIGATFTNTYKDKMTYGEATSLDVTKSLEGRDLRERQFNFKVVPKDIPSMNKAGIRSLEGIEFSNGAPGTDGVSHMFSPDELVFDQTDLGITYSYTFSEVNGGVEGYTYDSNVYTLEMTAAYVDGRIEVNTVVTDQNGKEIANVTGYSGINPKPVVTIAFKNAYDGEQTAQVFEGHKTMTGRELVGSDFEFILAYAADPEKKTISTVSNYPNGAIVFAEQTYTLESLAELVKDGYATKASDGMVDTYTISYIAFEKAGDSDSITHTESTVAFTVTVTDNGTGKLTSRTNYPESGMTFKNEYKSAPINYVVKGLKVLDCADGLTPDSIEGKFTFEIKAVTKDAPMPEKTEVVNDAYGNVDFGNIGFRLEDLADAEQQNKVKTKIFEYAVTETGSVPGVTNDSIKTKTFSITVTDNGEGLMTAVANPAEGPVFTFTNTYEADDITESITGTGNLTVTKNLTGRDQNAGEFSFELVEGQNVVAKGTNTADGTVTFDAITYTEPGTHVYSVHEVKGEAGGVTYDTAAYGVEAVVADDGKGQLDVKFNIADKDVESIVFNNEYKVAPATIKVVPGKLLEGRNQKAGEFQFKLIAVTDGAPMPVSDIAVNDESGMINFGEITYDKEGTWEYTISEIKGNVENVTYDETVHVLKVVVKDNMKGSLAAEVTFDGKETVPVFINKYKEPKPEQPTRPAEPTEPEQPTEPSDEPTQPEEPTQLEQPTKPMDDTSDGGTQTGDDFNAGLYGFLALAALAVAGAAFRRRKAE